MILKRLALLLFFASILTVGGCSHTSVNHDVEDLLAPIDDDAFYRSIDKQTRKDEGYSGFYNTFQGYLTFLSSEVKLGALRKLANSQSWDRKKATDEKEKDIQERASGSKFFLSFFTPEKEHNQLDFGSSIWTVTLEAKGIKYSGRVKKDTAKASQLTLLFPTHSRFHKAYEISFDVPTSIVEQFGGTVKLSSYLGEAVFVFKASTLQ